MTGEINMSKLDTKPELEEKKKTGTLPKLKFTDYAIERFISTFNGNYRKYTSFDVSRNGALKGLKLCQYNDTKKSFLCCSIGSTQKQRD